MKKSFEELVAMYEEKRANAKDFMESVKYSAIIDELKSNEELKAMWDEINLEAHREEVIQYCKDNCLDELREASDLKMVNDTDIETLVDQGVLVESEIIGYVEDHMYDRMVDYVKDTEDLMDSSDFEDKYAHDIDRLYRDDYLDEDDITQWVKDNCDVRDLVDIDWD